MTSDRAGRIWEAWDREVQAFPARAKKFLRRKDSGYEQTWEFFGNAYSRAFDKLVNATDGAETVDPAMFFLARHAMELAIKAAILEHAADTGRPARIDGHSLQALWNELGAQILAAGFLLPDPWGEHCQRVVQHIHEIDPTGEVARYPNSLRGEPFASTVVSIDDLGVAVWHVCYFCESAWEMLGAIPQEERR